MSIDWKARLEAIDADEAVKAANAKLNTAREAWQTAERLPLLEARKIPTWLTASDLMMRKGWEFENLPDEANQTLERLTGDDGEIWWNRYTEAEKALDALILATCERVTQLKAEAEALDKEREAAWNIYQAARTAAAEQYDAALKAAG